MKKKMALAGGLVAALIADAAESLTRQDLEKRLNELSQTPAPTKLAPGAMCYKMAMPPERIEYACPVCGERTLHAAKEDGRQCVEMVRGVDWYRRLVKQIKEKGLDVALDESAFCKKCGKNAAKKTLFLEVKKEDGKPSHRCELKSSEDLTLIIEFLDKKKTHRPSGPGVAEKPLKNYLPRIRELLGMKAAK